MRKEQRKIDMIFDLVALLIAIEPAWKYGLEGGKVFKDKKNVFTTYAPVEADPKNKTYILLQLGKITKRAGAVINKYHILDAEKKEETFQRVGGKLGLMSKAIDEALPHGSQYEHMVILTYLLYANFYDMVILHEVAEIEMKNLVTEIGILANHLLPQTSPLVMPMNQAYYKTRELVLERHEFYSVDWENAPQEIYFQAHEEKAA
jgi:hypothetical protein